VGSSEILHALILLLATVASVFLTAHGGIRRCPARVIPLLTWLIHSIIFSGVVLVWRLSGQAFLTPQLVNSWSLSVRLHAVLAVLMVAIWEYYARGRCDS
jgi:hypothetical protein